MSNLCVSAWRVSVKTAAQRLAGFAAQFGNFGFQFLDAIFERGIVTAADSFVAAFVGLFRVERLRTL